MHAAIAIMYVRNEVEYFVNTWYTKVTQALACEHIIESIPSMKSWLKIKIPHYIPPPLRALSSRPDKMRRKEDEPKDSSKIRIKGTFLRYKNCQQ